MRKRVVRVTPTLMAVTILRKTALSASITSQGIGPANVGEFLLVDVFTRVGGCFQFSGEPRYRRNGSA